MKNYRCLTDLQKDLEEEKITCVSLLKNYLSKIKETEHLNIFLEVFQESALSVAAEIDFKIKNGKAGRLAGMVIAVKDNICIKDQKATASSRILNGFESLFTATSVQRLLDEDAIIIGRTNCDEFAMGSSNKTSYYGPTFNPLDITKVPGGSSGGSAAAVAANLCLAALGSDTGGSIRQPASFCGVIGYKPTYGTISRSGLISYASSFDQIGPITNSIEDAEVLMQIMSGPDPKDSTTLKSVPTIDVETKYLKPRKIVCFKNILDSSGLEPEIKNHIQNQITILREKGHTVDLIDFPYLEYMLPVYYVLTTAEASSNLARFDGIHYGYRSQESSNTMTTYTKSRTEGFGEEVKRRIMLGTFVLSAGYYEAYYSKAQQVRRVIQEKTNLIFSEYDFILSPTTPHTAFEINKTSNDPTEMYLEDIFTVQANIVGCCAISLPTGAHSNGMPFGIQLVAKKNQDMDLLFFSREIMNI